jgi:hypothetical protein
MTSRPTFPLIVIDDSGYLDLIENEEHLTNTNALGLIKGFYKNFRGYDRNGSTWKVRTIESRYKITGLTKFLAYTVYNPSIKVTLTWAIGREYKIDDLKKGINKQVDKDDDTLTQFEEADVIKNEISNCNSFDDIIVTLNKYIFKVDGVTTTT